MNKGEYIGPFNLQPGNNKQILELKVTILNSVWVQVKKLAKSIFLTNISNFQTVYEQIEKCADAKTSSKYSIEQVQKFGSGFMEKKGVKEEQQEPVEQEEEAPKKEPEAQKKQPSMKEKLIAQRKQEKVLNTKTNGVKSNKVSVPKV